MIKALFFDLDGTLLTSGKRISSESAVALKRCRENGIKVFFATARSPMLDRNAGWTDREFALFDGGIYCNGACVSVGEKTEYAYLSPEAARVCVEQTALFKDVHLALHMKDEVYAFNHFLPDNALGFWGIDRNEIVALDESCYDRVVKILIYNNSMMDAEEILPVELYHRICERCGDAANIYLADQGKTIQVVQKGVSKYSAIEKMRNALGFEKDEVAVFGDDVNDAEMLSNYRYSVAMGNAVEEVKRIAGYSTLSNDEEGIAYAIENILRIV